MRQITENGLWRVFSQYIRQRDADWRGYARCITCSTVKDWRELDAGHYIPAGSCKALKYDERNVHAQCNPCNRHKSGDLINYRINLIAKIGEIEVKKLETLYQMKQPSPKLSQLEINEMYKEFKDKLATVNNNNLLKPYAPK